MYIYIYVYVYVCIYIYIDIDIDIDIDIYHTYIHTGMQSYRHILERAELSPGGAGSANRRYGKAVWRLRLSLSLHVLLANVNPTRSYRFARHCASRPQARRRWPYLHSSALCRFHPSVCWQIGMREQSRANLSIVVPLSFCGDCSARVQTVSANDDAWLYSLLR